MRILHLGAIVARLALDESREDRLHNIECELWCRIAICDREEVSRLWRDLDLRAELADHCLEVGGSGDRQIEVGARDQLFEIWPAQQRPLQDIELA